MDPRQSHASSFSPRFLTATTSADPPTRRRCCCRRHRRRGCTCSLADDVRYALALRARPSQSGEGCARIDRGTLGLFFISRIIANARVPPMSASLAKTLDGGQLLAGGYPTTLKVSQGYYNTLQRVPLRPRSR